MSQNQEIRYQINPVVSCGEEKDGAVLYNPDIDVTSVINLCGQKIWKYLQTPRTREEIADHLVQSYSDVTLQQAAEDTKLFIEALAPDFLIEIKDDS